MAGFIIAYALCTLIGGGLLFWFEPRLRTASFWLLWPLSFGIGTALLIVIHQILLLILV
ncbi:MAG: hypothetical protein KAZ30_02955 [Candidatus Magasanikbacteria bacterium]|nr:hypothetical protein [Candidatus Magasanikbacteria bacterium]